MTAQKPFSLVSLLIGGALLSTAAAAQAAAPTPPSPESLVKQALQAEMAGDAPLREQLLDEALQIDPDYAPAHWQRGEVRRGSAWTKAEDVRPSAQQDRRLTAYRQRRAALVSTADGHRDLARWCEKSRLRDQARVHWNAVLEYLPNDGEALRGAKVDTEAVAASDRQRKEAARQRASESAKNLKAWQPRLKTWREQFRQGGLDGANRTVEEISTIQDPAAAPALLAALADRGFQEPRLRNAVYQGLGNLRLPEVTQYFVNLAMYGEGNAREAAIEQLRRRPMHVYVPQLLAAVPPDVKSKFQIYMLPGGGVLHEHEVAVSTQDADYAYKLENFVQPADLAAAQRFTPQALAREVGRSSAIENEVRQIDVQATDLRKRIRDVLDRTTSLELSDNALDWKKQYEEQYAIYTPDTERNYYSQVTGTTEAPFTPPVQTTTGARRFQAPSNVGLHPECFVRGTSILTDLGPKAIETIQPGDRVLSQNIETGELAYQPVLQTTIRPPTAIVEVRTDGRQPLAAAAGHPFWVAGKGWEIAKALKPGDRLRTTRGLITIDGVESRPATEAYNLVVDDLHTYFAGEAQILVHDNAPLPEQPQQVPGL